MNVEMTSLEEETFYEVGPNEIPPQDIVAYNELRSCADLFRMFDQGILEIQPDFQRDIVWAGPMQTRFIDSLVKQLPIPSMCFAMDYKKQRWLVIDGLQRIWTIIKFLKGTDWRLSKLEDIDQDLSGRSVASIKDNLSNYYHFYTRVENLSIPITVLRCDFSKKSHMQYLFTIFHRLNTGGMKLNNQEIRNCIYGGSLNDLLKQSDNFPAWRKLNKMKPNDSYRFTKQEIVLRFFAFIDDYPNYNGQLANFLNNYMHANQNLDNAAISIKKDLFELTVTVIYSKIFMSKPPQKLPVTHLEALLVAVGSNIDLIINQPETDISKLYDKLLKHDEFSEASLREGLSKRHKVIARLDAAVELMREFYV